MSLQAFGTKFENKEVPGDGSCLLHSICEAIDAKYHRLEGICSKRNYVRALRKDLAHCILTFPDFQQFITTELPGIRDAHFPGLSNVDLFNKLANELLSNLSLFYYHVPILGYYFSYGNIKVDIVLLQADVLNGRRKGIPIYGLTTHDYIKGNADAYIFVMCTENHYSLLTSGNGTRRIFSKRNSCVRALLELLKKQD